MKTISKEELQERIKLHELWIKDSSQGRRLTLIGYDLSGSNLSGSNLSYSNLRYSNLRYSNLRGSNLSYSNLSYSNLSGSNLRYSDLRYSNLRGSNLSYSNLRDNDLRNCTGNMEEVKSLHFDQWIVTYTDSVLCIGCRSHSIDEWFAFDDETIGAMDPNALTWWHKYRDILKQLIGVSK